LNGAPDPWGMVVNPHYKGIKLPVIGWPLLDTFQKGAVYDRGNNSCLAANPVPFLPLVAAPVLTMASVTLNMQFDIANSQIICRNSGAVDQKLVAIGRESPGKRFIMGLTTLRTQNCRPPNAGCSHGTEEIHRRNGPQIRGTGRGLASSACLPAESR
jgi:hypothetical protein